MIGCINQKSSVGDCQHIVISYFLIENYELSVSRLNLYKAFRSHNCQKNFFFSAAPISTNRKQLVCLKAFTEYADCFQGNLKQKKKDFHRSEYADCFIYSTKFLVHLLRYTFDSFRWPLIFYSTKPSTNIKQPSFNSN